MSISNKKIFESFYSQQNPVKDTSVSQESTLYSQFKSIEKDLILLLEGKSTFPIVLEQHISFTRPKSNLLQIVSQLFESNSHLPLIESKRLDERFWVLLKKELRRAKQEKKLKPSLSQSYFENISKNKETIASLLKKTWPILEPLKDPHIPDTFLRKLFGKLFQMLGEILKQKSKVEKPVLNEVKEFYLRSNKVYSFSPRCQELLGLVHSKVGDLFGAVYWYTRALALPEPANTKDKLLGVYEELRMKWEKHSTMTKVSSQPPWYVSFCLSFLRIQGIFLSGVNTENLQFLYKVCNDHMETFLSKGENSHLIVSMVVIWIFSIHISQQNLSQLPQLINHDPSLFNTVAPGQCQQVIDLFSQFMLKIMQKINNPDSPWTSPLLIFLYWVSSYRGLRKIFIKDSIYAELTRIEQLVPEDLTENCHLLLPEDLSIIGFLPLHYYYLGHKDFFNTQATASEESGIRMKSLKTLCSGILEESEEIKQENEGVDEFFGLGAGLSSGFDFPGLTFEEVKHSKQLVVVDGPNIAVRHGNGGFSCKGLRIVLNYYVRKGFDVKIVVPEQYLQEDRAEELKFRGAKNNKIPIGLPILKELDSHGHLIKTPPMDYDDSYCLQYAKDKNAIVVSNDRFWDHIKKHPEAKNWVREHTCSFTFAGDDFIPNPDFSFT